MSTASSTDVSFDGVSRVPLEEKEPPRALPKRTINLWRFVVIAYGLVCGGAFGIEVAVNAAGPGPTLLGFLLLPFLWSLPQALMTAEVASMLPGNGGYVLWSQVAFGHCAGWITAVNGLLASLFDLALYPALFSDALRTLVDLSDFQALLARIGMVMFCCILNMRGVDAVAVVMAFITFMVIMPFVVYFFWELPHLFSSDNGINFTQHSTTPDYSLFFSTLMWSYTGWDSLGCIAGEVKNPAKTYWRGTLITLTLVTLTYTLPVLTSIQLHPEFDSWEDGSFLEFVKDVARWMGVWASIASMFANFGMYNSELTANTRALWALGGGGGDQSMMGVNHVPKFLGSTWERYGTPAASILFHTFFVIGLNFFDFSVLVEADMILTGVRLYVEFSAFLWFRWKWPRVHRFYRVPGGWPGAIGITIPKVILITVLLVSADLNTWILTLAVNGSATVLYFLRKRYGSVYSVPHDNTYGKRFRPVEDDDLPAPRPHTEETAVLLATED